MKIAAAWLVIGLSAAAGAQGVPSGQVPVAPNRTNVKTDAQIELEAKEADRLYSGSKTLESLPLYEDLHAQRPQKVYYTERLAMAYVLKAGATEGKPEKLAALARARALVEEARKGNDDSQLINVLVEELDSMTQSIKAPPKAGPGEATLAQAELVFARGDIPGALALYQQAWQENPKLYGPPLFAGDMEFRLKHYAQAGVWYARAIAIDPDRETAYRYWGDSLAEEGKTAEARKRYVDTLICDPYSRSGRLGLKNWTEKQHLRYFPPPVTLPAAPTVGKDGHINITIDGSKKDDPLAPAWLMYSMNSALWQGDKFKKEFPKEKVYRHSLAEEVDTLHLLLTSVREQKIPESKYDATIRSLMMLEKDGMLECWILLDKPDQGVARDYAAYRAGHRDLLKAYVEKYDLHPA